MLGQVAYHLLSAAHSTRAPWPVTVLVACLPVITLGFGVALAHLMRADLSPHAAAEADAVQVHEGAAVQDAERVSRDWPPAELDASAAFSAPRSAEPLRVTPACSDKWLSHRRLSLVRLRKALAGKGSCVVDM